VGVAATCAVCATRPLHPAAAVRRRSATMCELGRTDSSRRLAARTTPRLP
jgi:hypothetical protein